MSLDSVCVLYFSLIYSALALFHRRFRSSTHRKKHLAVTRLHTLDVFFSGALLKPQALQVALDIPLQNQKQERTCGVFCIKNPSVSTKNHWVRSQILANFSFDTCSKSCLRPLPVSLSAFSRFNMFSHQSTIPRFFQIRTSNPLAKNPRTLDIHNQHE